MNKQYNREIVFGEVSTTTINNVISGTNVSNTSASSDKLVFDELSSFDTTTATITSFHNGIQFEILLSSSYNGSTMAIVDENRLSTTFVVNTATSTQTPLFSGFQAVSPNLARLWSLNYV